MEGNELFEYIKERLIKADIAHSDEWVYEIIEALQKAPNYMHKIDFNIDQINRRLHEKLRKVELKYVLAQKFVNEPDENQKFAEDVVGEAYIEFHQKFNPLLSTEKSYHRIWTINKLHEIYNRENPIVHSEKEVDDSGNAIMQNKRMAKKNGKRLITPNTVVDRVEKPKKKNLRAIKKPTFDEEGNPIEIEQSECQSMEEQIDTQNRKIDKNYRQRYLIETMERYGNEVAKKLAIFYSLYNASFSAIDEHIFTKVRIQPTYDFIKHIKDDDSIENFLVATDYYKQRVKAFKPEREFMENCIKILKRGIDAFEKSIKNPTTKFKPNHKLSIPMLSAIAIDANGEYIADCYKGEKEEFNPQGEKKTFELHCEYALLELVINTTEDKARLKGGTLFVTLEPCNKRKYYCQNPACDDNCKHDKSVPKIPCAVRCLESGINRIYISNADTDQTVLNKGIFILKTGTYPIEIDSKNKYVLHDSKEEHRAKEERGLELLEEYFKSKSYSFKNYLIKDLKEMHPEITFHNNTKSIRLYTISNPVEVLPFHSDLAEEIIKLNASFLQTKDESSKFFLPK